jgi:hypothetical protein
VALVPSLLALSMAWVPAASAAAPSPRVQFATGAIARFLGGADPKIQAGGRCSPGSIVLEAFVYLTQDGYTTESAYPPLTCDGRFHGGIVLIPLADVPFHEGAASATGYALVEDPDTGETASVNWVRDITILP